MATPVYYSVCPFGTANLLTGGSPTIVVDASGNATLTLGGATQADNIGQGVCVEYAGVKSYIDSITDTTHFHLVTALGANAAAQASTPVTSIHHDYASVNDARAGMSDANHLHGSDLTALDVVVHLACYYDHVDYTPHGSVVMSGSFTTDVTRYIHVYTPAGGNQSIHSQRDPDGKFNDQKFYCESTDWNIIHSQVPYTHYEGICIVDGSDNVRTNLLVQGSVPTRVTDCVLVRLYPGSSQARGLAAESAAVNIENCIAIGFITSSGTSGSGFHLGNIAGSSIYNSVAYGGYYGIRVGGPNPLIVNCAGFGSTGADISSYSSLNAACKNNAAGNVTPPGSAGVDLSGYTAAQIWTDAAGGDFSLVSGSPLIAAGIGPALDANVPATDILGNPRSGDTCSIGAFEYVSEGGGFNPAWAMHSNVILQPGAAG
jgi:hypothetical protein